MLQMMLEDVEKAAMIRECQIVILSFLLTSVCKRLEYF
jgi:hypothetical protein